MAYKNTQPESLKGRTYTKLMESRDPAATLEFGLSLGIAKARLERWLKKWESDLKATHSVETKKTNGRRRVYQIGDPNVFGTVIEAGAEVSGVKWDTGPSPQYVGNEHLRNVDNEPSDTDKFVFKNAAFFSVMEHSKRVEKFTSFSKAKKAAEGNDRLTVYAVTKAGRSILLLRNLWGQYTSLGRMRI